MNENRKKRLNLYIDKDLYDFAKKWSHVIRKPISRMLEDSLRSQQELVKQVTPFQWLNDPSLNPDAAQEDESIHDLEEYLNNREEEAFCRANPAHPRARMRRKLEQEYKSSIARAMEARKSAEQEIIKRWIEAFPAESAAASSNQQEEK